jgi:ubiquinone/menaquinone biosynthesis C-methylase UbiE/uncharacterized protein YbaR (Trm112 family)
MKHSTLELLLCPGCRGALSVQGDSGEEYVDCRSLECTGCGRSFRIEDGIVHFTEPDELTGLNVRFVRFYKRYSRFEAAVDRLSFILSRFERKARGEVLGRLELDGGRLLEVSIGAGANLPYIFESPGTVDVFGLDISIEQLDVCRRRVEKHNWPVELFLGNAETLPFGPDSFDNVLHIGGINFFTGKKKAIEEMIRVARPGAKIVIADESERIARMTARMLRLSRWNDGNPVDTSVPVHLVPREMEEIKVEGIWKRHGLHHGYCIEFRKPKS